MQHHPAELAAAQAEIDRLRHTASALHTELQRLREDNERLRHNLLVANQRAVERDRSFARSLARSR